MNEKIPEIILEFRDISGICFFSLFFRNLLHRVYRADR